MRPVLRSDRVVVVTDSNVAGLHLARLQRGLDDAGLRHESLVVPPGDGSKSLDQLGRLIGQLLDRKVERSTTLVARSEEHTSELPSLMRNSYAVFWLKNKKIKYKHTRH